MSGGGVVRSLQTLTQAHTQSRTTHTCQTCTHRETQTRRLQRDTGTPTHLFLWHAPIPMAVWGECCGPPIPDPVEIPAVGQPTPRAQSGSLRENFAGVGEKKIHKETLVETHT